MNMKLNNVIDKFDAVLCKRSCDEYYAKYVGQSSVMNPMIYI